jgi:hypothetical protein
MLAKQVLYHLSLEPLHQPCFMLGIFEIRSCKLFACSWLQTMILVISVSRVARSTGLSHQHPDRFWLLSELRSFQTILSKDVTCYVFNKIMFSYGKKQPKEQVWKQGY